MTWVMSANKWRPLRNRLKSGFELNLIQNAGISRMSSHITAFELSQMNVCGIRSQYFNGYIILAHCNLHVAGFNKHDLSTMA